jgi:DNA-binding response OmpR family regulator
MKDKILVVEDNHNIQLMLKAIITAAGYEIIIANNGEAGACALYNDDEIKAVICDIMMPKSDGFEFLDKTKCIRGEKNIPVCMLTAINDSKKIIQSLQFGADNYLVKPIDKEILLEKISLMLKSGDAQTFSTCKADFTVRLHLFESPVTVKALNETAIIVSTKDIEIALSDVFQLEHSKLNELTGISDFIVKTTKVTEFDGSKAAKLDFIGLTEEQRKKIRSITIRGEEISEFEINKQEIEDAS